jgi:hypothetical protein
MAFLVSYFQLNGKTIFNDIKKFSGKAAAITAQKTLPDHVQSVIIGSDGKALDGSVFSLQVVGEVVPAKATK